MSTPNVKGVVSTCFWKDQLQNISENRSGFSPEPDRIPLSQPYSLNEFLIQHFT
jgi:hypothetical protein